MFRKLSRKKEQDVNIIRVKECKSRRAQYYKNKIVYKYINKIKFYVKKWNITTAHEENYLEKG